LENVTIPKISNVLKYIERELDELEREGTFVGLCCDATFIIPTTIMLTCRPHSWYIDFTRLKLVQGKKEEQIKIEEAAKEAARKAEAASGRVRKELDHDITANFDVTDDSDVVF
jgi:V-type H+-transporting ATPase subunit D